MPLNCSLRSLHSAELIRKWKAWMKQIERKTKRGGRDRKRLKMGRGKKRGKSV